MFNLQGTLRVVTVSVVVPVFHGEQTPLELHRQLSTAMPQITSAFEIIFVEDGGGDSSWAIVAGLAHEDHRVRGIRMSRNYGQHNALLCGIRAARYDIIITMDDDLQHPVSEVPKMLAALTRDYDVVYGARRKNGMGWIPTRSATPSTALVPQRKVGFPIPNPRLLLGFQGTKTARREGISSPFSDAGGCTSPQNSGGFVRDLAPALDNFMVADRTVLSNMSQSLHT